MSRKTFSLSVRTLIEQDDGRVLLLCRSNLSRHWPGWWETPGGKVDPGESLESALLREAREETGLKIELSGVIGASEIALNDDLQVVVLMLRARLTGGEVKLSDEHEGHKWAKWDEIPNLQIVPGVSDLLRAEIQRRRAKL